MRSCARLFLLVLSCFLLIAASPEAEQPLNGYSAASSRTQREWETKFRAIPEPQNLRDYMQRLAARLAGRDHGHLARRERRHVRVPPVRHLEAALDHWKRYAAVYSSQYKPQLLNRVGFIDVPKLTTKVEQDVAIARGWQPGTLKEPDPRSRRGDSPFRP